MTMFHTDAFRRTAEPAILPVTLAELKQFARIDVDSEDDILCAFLLAATEGAETYTRRAFIEQKWEYAISEWPTSRVLRLPRPPLVSIDQIKVFADDGTYDVLCAHNYYLNTLASPGEVVLTSSAVVAPTRYPYGIVTGYTCGYGAAAASVPAEIRQGILHWAAIMYEERVPMKKAPGPAATLLFRKRVQML